jgi:hypothetical protein
VVDQLVVHKEKGDYVFDPNKEKRAKEVRRLLLVARGGGSQNTAFNFFK